ncbi:DUF4157 domain-containing protein [Pseudonocardia xinjiangensis]|uniref:eCIS core domain-containing protein n=1 Tax=Pseudonocardia xinjiangensis TaxID=75289 RepID=UPI003D8DAF02
MREQGRRPDRSDARQDGRRTTARPPAAPTAAALPPVTALQHTAGNSAVVQLLAQQEDDVPAASPDVQRSSVHSVLRSPGRPLEDSLRTEMEARLGADFRSVRLHDTAAADRSAAEIGARAYTSGEHVVVGRQGRDKHTLAHELTHVIQQRSGPVSGTTDASGLSISDPSDSFERAAEANAARALRGSVPVGAQVAEDEEPAVQRSASVPVQRLVTVNNVEVYSDLPSPSGTPRRSADELMQNVTRAIEASNDRELIAQFTANRAKVHAQAMNWVGDSRVGTWAGAGSQKLSTHQYGRKKQKRVYKTYEEAGRALVGWVLQKPGRHEEKEFANQLMDDPDLAADLDSALTKVRAWITTLGSDPSKLHDPTMTVNPGRILSELTSGQGVLNRNPKAFGRYQEHFDRPTSPNPTKFQGNFLAVLDHPDQYPVRDKIIVLHDLTDYFKPENTSRRDEADTAGRGVLPDTPDNSRLLSTQEMNPDGTRKVAGSDRGSKTTVRDENAPSTRMARENRIPVTAGQSFTAARLLHLGNEAGATADELNAMALSIFALWRIDYDHTVDLAAHTLHEVLDIASNFGLAYNMKVPQRASNQYPQVVAKRAKRTNEKLRAQLSPLRNAVANMKSDIESRFLGSRRQTGRKRLADNLLGEYTAELARSDQARADLENADATTAPQVVEQLKTDYYAALRRTIQIYQQLCDVVKAKRIEDRLTEDDRDAVGASRIPLTLPAHP